MASQDHGALFGVGIDGNMAVAALESAVTIADTAITHDFDAADRSVIGVFAHYTQATGSKTCVVTVKVSADGGTTWHDFSSNTLTLNSAVSGGSKQAARFSIPPCNKIRLSSVQSDSTAGGTLSLWVGVCEE